MMRIDRRVGQIALVPRRTIARVDREARVAKTKVRVRPLAERDLGEADRIFRVAFGTFIGLPDPTAFGGDADYVRTRWRAAPDRAIAAEIGGRLVGSNFLARWGSVGFFGPLTIDPEFWGSGAAPALLERTVALFARWRLKHTGLFTFSSSPKHVGLYGKFGFHPRFLTPVVARVAQSGPKRGWRVLSSLAPDERSAAIAACRALAGRIFPGLDLTSEVESVATQRLGDTVLVGSIARQDAFAVCHVGAGSEAGSGTCYVKFGAARPGRETARSFRRLLDAIDAFALERAAPRVTFGVNAAREEAYREIARRGYRADRVLGVVMERRTTAGYNRPGVFVLDDWR
jgi:GNAT superfamily N-acetyltransferase